MVLEGGGLWPPLAMPHNPMVSHAPGVVMPSPAGSPHSHPAPPHQQHPHNPPCSTLFIANLGHNVAEHDLKDIFSRDTRLKLMEPRPAAHMERLAS
ncbi:hypothetical protein GWK47_028916 [Chionoecetes opilio]|uniref:Uncharacterized protein n=1 Tax=Chionoecetes opilio TaxID=41210 RepID=A0A8J5D5V9_CHIOP|nr:hypothetical protein GWK47_028916 [Chionoecetes opilio]